MRKTDNIRLKAIFEKFDLFIKAYMSISNPASVSEPSDKMKDHQIQLDEIIVERDDYKSKWQAALSTIHDKDREINKLSD